MDFFNNPTVNAAALLNLKFINHTINAVDEFLHSEAFSSTVHTTTANFHAALAAVLEFIKAHPTEVTGIVIQAGSILILGPGGAAALPLKVIGFRGAGPVLGSVAAWWQSTVYGAYIPAGSIFSFCQSMGMKVSWMQAVLGSAGWVVAGMGAIFKGNGTTAPVQSTDLLE